MRMRRAGKQNSVTKTIASLGVMKEDSKIRSEFLALITPGKNY